MAASPLSVVIHGHFYQPPREDPWLEMVEAQPSAAPYHDWNERVTEECYRAVVAARVPGPEGRISSILNTLELISFNFGPTLLEWMEKEAPETYQAVLEADAKSIKANAGHGNALAQAYHHTILPLASRREKISEVRWGIADFQNRFRRRPSGMWLPETAVDGTTLDVLAQEGIAFTIVAPHQVKAPPIGGQPGLFRTPGGRSIALFVYDGPFSQGVAFGPLLKDAEKWAKDVMMMGQRELISIATDGETYGHHHRFGEMALAAVLNILLKDTRVQVENFAAFLARNPPIQEVELVELSSWSCSHGVERWRSDCGCKMDPSEATQQEWRAALREAVEWLASQMHEVFSEEGPPLLGDPWEARNRYGPFADTETSSPRALELLEMERQTLRLFTSCGWFFDDLAGIEPVQILRYAARALELVGARGLELEEGFLKRLDRALSNETPVRSGRAIFLEEAKPRIAAHLRVAGGAALWDAVTTSTGPTGDGPGSGPGADSLETPGPADPGVPGFLVAKSDAGRFTVTHLRTRRQWEVDTRVGRPSKGPGVVSVRDGGLERFLPLELEELPEGYRVPMAEVIARREPEPSLALISAIRDLEDGAQGSVRLPSEKLEKVDYLAELHILLGKPIPFDAQTLFFRILSEASGDVARQLSVLRTPLGFTPAP
jgi:hypothetical protein